MSFKDKFLNIDNHYNNDTLNIAKDLLVPIMKEAKFYDRAVGFFCSRSLIETSIGISEIVRKGGHIRYIMSPKLSLEDIEAIKHGYETKIDYNPDDDISNILLKSIIEPCNDYEKDYLNYLANLISLGYLDIKIAVLKKEYWTNGINPNKTMFHTKIGILRDEEKNIIGFDGSANDTDNGYVNNFESITLLSSWNNPIILNSLVETFEKNWNNSRERYEFMEFPKAVKEKILTYKVSGLDLSIDDKVYEDDTIEKIVFSRRKPFIPLDENGEYILYDYQKDAIKKWITNDAVGIYNMATGSGKTYTAYGSIVKLLECKKNNRLPVVIVCPFIHLVDQWVEEIEMFGLDNYVVGYSGLDYKRKLREMVIAYNCNDINYFVFVVCLASFKKQETQNILSEVNGGGILLVADEAHNMGAADVIKILDDKYKYRLALSATLERHNDETGTEFLYQYFGKECINYTLKDAIRDGKLCEYKYYPIINYMNEFEREKYIEISRQIGPLKKKKAKIELTSSQKMKLLERARLVAGIESKVINLKEMMTKHLNEYYMLIYCGTSKRLDNEVEIKQITEVCSYLGKELNIKIAKYTAEESSEERKIIKSRFESGDDLQAMVAIKCLDEGVNIPNSKIAFILASSTNPREYVQRRGRILRKPKNNPNKKAIIYDFISLPCDDKELQNYSLKDIQYFKSLIKNEILRIQDFTDTCINKSNGIKLIEELNEIYNLDEFEILDVDWSDFDA